MAVEKRASKNQGCFSASWQRFLRVLDFAGRDNTSRGMRNFLSTIGRELGQARPEEARETGFKSQTLNSKP